MAKIEPLLSAEEWARLEIEGDNGDAEIAKDGALVCTATSGDVCVFTGRDRLRVGALALHDQPLGFSGDDVWRLRAAAEVHFSLAREHSSSGAESTAKKYQVRAVALVDLADRLAALLPPEP